MSQSPSDQSESGRPRDLKGAVGEATERIHEIIDAAERVASDIRRDAESEARAYIEERRREADRAAEERSKALDELTRSVADTAEEFKHQAEKLLSELDRAVVDARAGIYREGARAAVQEDIEEADEESDPEPPPIESEPFSADALPPSHPTRKPFGLEPLPPLDAPDSSDELPPLDPDQIERDRPEPPEQEPERPEPAAVTAYPGNSDSSWEESAPADDHASEALLRATQLAVTGKARDEIADALRADFPGVDTDPLLDEILG
jgi:hypothetical protein